MHTHCGHADEVPEVLDVVEARGCEEVCPEREHVGDVAVEAVRVERERLLKGVCVCVVLVQRHARAHPPRLHAHNVAQPPRIQGARADACHHRREQRQKRLQLTRQRLDPRKRMEVRHSARGLWCKNVM
jgi:hypothetical protein